MSHLLVTDPLAQQAVSIVITVMDTDVPRLERPILLSLGLLGQLPQWQAGTLADVPDLIDQAWHRYPAVSVVNHERAEQPLSQEETVLTTIPITPTDKPPAQQQPPTAKNLSLF